MIDKKERQNQVVPVNKHVSTRFVEFEERKTKGGLIIPKSVEQDDFVTMKGEKIYKVKILKKADNCKSEVPSKGYALINQLSGFGIPTVEKGYLKVVHENSLLMTSETKDFTLESTKPGIGRALVEVTSKLETTESGIIAPAGARNNTTFDAATLGGTVVSVPDDMKSLKVGDVVRFDSYMGTEIHMGGKEYRMVLECEVIAKIDNTL